MNAEDSAWVRPRNGGEIVAKAIQTYDYVNRTAIASWISEPNCFCGVRFSLNNFCMRLPCKRLYLTKLEQVEIIVSSERTLHSEVEPITQALMEAFGTPNLGNKRNPFNELLYVLLSSKTPPNRYQKAYRALRQYYPYAGDLAETEPEEVAEVIRLAGLQNRKARAIVAIARRLKRDFGRVTLSPLRVMNKYEAERFLLSLPEVNLKIARCVLMYAFGHDVFPVDTHCYRISRRLGWVTGGPTPTKQLQERLQQGIPERLRRDLHVGMVLLGRQYCTVTNPNCFACPVLKFCPTGQEVTISRLKN